MRAVSRNAVRNGVLNVYMGTALLIGGAVCSALGCAGGLSAAAGVKLDSKTGLSTKLETKASGDLASKADTKADAVPELGPALESVLSGEHRSAEHRARDKYQHPKETLEFFGLKPDMNVLEVEPGADGWFTEVLAPLLKDHGRYSATNFDVNGPDKSPLTADARAYQAKLDGAPEAYGKVQVVTLTKDYNLGAADSYDMVVTFRNSHLWKQDKIEDRVYGEMFRVLKPGGVLGLVQHRAAAGDNPAKSVSKGYLPQPYVIERVEKAGFKFEAESHVNTNSWDTRDYPKGVWSLPPSLAQGEKDKEKFLKIGESDRMTLLFRKPLTSSSEPEAAAVPAPEPAPGSVQGTPAPAVAPPSASLSSASVAPSIAPPNAPDTEKAATPVAPEVAPPTAPLPAPAPKAPAKPTAKAKAEPPPIPPAPPSVHPVPAVSTGVP